MNTYKGTIDFLFTQMPMFQQIGANAYKPGLDTVKSLSAKFDNPHEKFKCIHIAGTNGKGSTAHTIAAVLQCAGYRVGLFTSPHLIDFRERIRVNGEMISENEVINFVERFKSLNFSPAPSFFELTTIMAFEWFASSKVDIAVIETGLGGRLDSTNIITPDLSIITNISFDHVNLLGNTLPQIAYEKAGIIKEGIPVVVGEAQDPAVKEVFITAAKNKGSEIFFADENAMFSASMLPEAIKYKDSPYGDFIGALSGECQIKNTSTIITALRQLEKIGWVITDSNVKEGFAKVNELTGLMGRWMIMSHNPKIICDTGHNIGGWKYISNALKDIPDLHIVIGFVNDKDVTGILALMPKNAHYYFTRASVTRSMSEETLQILAQKEGLKGEAYSNVPLAVNTAMENVTTEGTIFVGGSTFIIADFLAERSEFKAK